MSTADRRAHVVLNVAALLGELIGALFLVVAGLGVAAPAFGIVLGVGAGYGLAIFVLSYTMYIRSGAHINPGVTLAKFGAWISGLAHRDYFGTPGLLWDAVMGLAYIGMQLAGAVLGVLVLRFVDRSGILAAAVATAPNGNLAGDEGRALFLAFFCNLMFIWVHLTVFGPRTGTVIKLLGGPLVLGITYGGVAIVSVYWGTGTVCNFALDLAFATLLSGTTVKKLWISFVAQLLGALAALLVYAGQSWADANIELLMRHGAKDMGHVRINSLRDVFMLFEHAGTAALDDAGSREALVEAHDIAPETQRAAHVPHNRAHHLHHRGMSTMMV
jgi:glycerol uptake facilitator-like aquaporin